jgi:hypothetical protein
MAVESSRRPRSPRDATIAHDVLVDAVRAAAAVVQKSAADRREAESAGGPPNSLPVSRRMVTWAASASVIGADSGLPFRHRHRGREVV